MIPHPAADSGKLPPVAVLCEICNDEIKGLLIGIRRGGFAANCCFECGAELGAMCAEGVTLSTYPRQVLIKLARARMASKRPSWAQSTAAMLEERWPLWKALATL